MRTHEIHKAAYLARQGDPLRMDDPTVATPGVPGEEVDEVDEEAALVNEDLTREEVLNELTAEKLKELAKAYGLTGTSKASKSDLVDMILTHEAELAAAEATEVEATTEDTEGDVDGQEPEA